MDIRFAVLSFLVICGAGVSASGKERIHQGMQSNISSCSGSGCTQFLSMRSVHLHSISPIPALQAVPFAMPLLMMWDGLRGKHKSTIERYFGPVESREGVRLRVLFGIVVILALAYGSATFAMVNRYMQEKRCPNHKHAYLLYEVKEGPDKGVYNVHGDREPDLAPEGYVDMDLQDMVSETGVSGMCILNPQPAEEQNTTTSLSLGYTVPIIAFQGILLQGGLLFYMVMELNPQSTLPPSRQRENALPYGVVFVALYIHLVNCVNDIPNSWQLIKHFWDFHHNLRDMLWMGPPLVADSIVVPALVLFIGGLYIPLARSPVDVILNSVAVAFVKDIDNWILTFVTRASAFAGTLQDRRVRIPTNQETMSMIMKTLVYYPVLPLIVTAILMYVALFVFKL